MAYRSGRSVGRGARGFAKQSSSRSGGSFQTRNNASGYREYKVPGGDWSSTHRRVAEKKIGGPIGAGREVHHINGNKQDNRPGNLRVVSAAVHRLIHGKRK